MSQRLSQQQTAIRSRARRLRFFSRSSLYIARTLLLVFCGAALCVLSFVSCARLANLYILVNEGMAQRAECILQDGSLEELPSFFTPECIAADGRLSDTTYDSYTITSYNYILDFSRIRVWPWYSTLQVDVLEQVDRIAGYANANASDPDGAPPAWTPTRYRLEARRLNGSWRISSLTILELNPDIEPLPTADPNQSPLPMATPTESPVPSPQLVIGTPLPNP